MDLSLLDSSATAFDSVYKDLTESGALINTEADTRLQIIDRILTEVLNWPYSSILTEPHTESGYIDYLVTLAGQGKMVVEAKRSTTNLIDSANDDLVWRKLNGSSLRPAIDGIKQAKAYCLDTATQLCVLSNGEQWIGFWALRSDGTPPGDGKAAVFPSLQSIQNNFSQFYELFSLEGVQRRHYQVLIKRAEGMKIATPVRLEAIIRPHEIKLEVKDELASDLEAIYHEFFGEISREDDEEMLAECFVESKESAEADERLQKITSHLIDHVDVVESGESKELQRRIEGAMQSRRGEFVLIIGNKGAGKSTFINRFFRLVLDKKLRSRCLLIRINLAESDGDSKTVLGWLRRRTKELVEEAIFPNGPDYDDLRGAFMGTYNRWRNAEFKPLYDSDRDKFRIKFGKHLFQLAQDRPEEYTAGLLRDAIESRKMMPCIVFDNADHFDREFQESVFQYAQSIHQRVYSFVICPITDRTVWRLSKEGPLQSYSHKAFYLPVPATKEILSKRIEYIKRKSEGAPTSTRAYFTEKGIKLSIGNIGAFASTVEHVFVKEAYVGRLIGWLANFDIRRSLKMAERIITSPSIRLVDIFTAFVTGTSYDVSRRHIVMALTRGSYQYYYQQDSEFVMNLFSVFPQSPTSPLLRLSILSLLQSVWSENKDTDHSYVTVGYLRDYLRPMGVDDSVAMPYIEQLLDHRLIEPYDPSDPVVSDDLRVRIAPAGRMHQDLAFADMEAGYMIDMALTTQISDMGLINRYRSIVVAGRQFEWDQLTELLAAFASYCLDSDAHYVDIPRSEDYTHQFRLRDRFRRVWSEKD